jgi:hypothetical protein
MQGIWWEDLGERSNLEDLGVDGKIINPLNAVLNRICHLVALLGTHHFLHVTRVKVKVDYNEVI